MPIHQPFSKSLRSTRRGKTPQTNRANRFELLLLMSDCYYTPITRTKHTWLGHRLTMNAIDILIAIYHSPSQPHEIGLFLYGWLTELNQWSTWLCHRLAAFVFAIVAAKNSCHEFFIGPRASINLQEKKKNISFAGEFATKELIDQVWTRGKRLRSQWCVWIRPVSSIW